MLKNFVSVLGLIKPRRFPEDYGMHRHLRDDPSYKEFVSETINKQKQLEMRYKNAGI